MEFGEYVGIRLKEYKITKEDRIRYQLHKRGYTIGELLLSKDREGNDWTDKDKKEYIEEVIEDYDDGRTEYIVELERYKSYISRMNKKGYKDLCKRLGISENISLEEMEEIRLWKERLEKEKISFQKRLPREKGDEEKEKDNTKPSKEIREKREKATEGLSDIVENWFEDELEVVQREERFEPFYKKQFMENASMLSDDVLVLFEQFDKLFTKEGRKDIVFLREYEKMNQTGRNIINEIILQHLDKNDYVFSDDLIEQYERLKSLEPIRQLDKREERLERIWNTWAYSYVEEDIDLCADIANYVLQVESGVWETVINYHRLQVLGEALVYDGMRYLDVLDTALGIVMSVSSLKADV